MAKPDLKIRMVDLAYLLSVVAHQHTKRSDIEHAIRRHFGSSGAASILVYDADDNAVGPDRSVRLGKARLENE